jgi:hypothetical protein
MREAYGITAVNPRSTLHGTYAEAIETSLGVTPISPRLRT